MNNILSTPQDFLFLIAAICFFIKSFSRTKEGPFVSDLFSLGFAFISLALIFAF